MSELSIPDDAWTAYAEATIAAPRQRVWDVLVDFDGYDAWNPFTYDVDMPSMAVGEVFVLTAVLGNGRTRRQREVIKRIDPPHVIAWAFPPHFLGKAVRYQMLTELDNGHTRYQTWERFTGMLGVLVRWTVLGAVQRGFDEMAAALAEYVESRG